MNGFLSAAFTILGHHVPIYHLDMGKEIYHLTMCCTHKISKCILGSMVYLTKIYGLVSWNRSEMWKWKMLHACIVLCIIESVKERYFCGAWILFHTRTIEKWKVKLRSQVNTWRETKLEGKYIFPNSLAGQYPALMSLDLVS